MATKQWISFGSLSILLLFCGNWRSDSFWVGKKYLAVTMETCEKVTHDYRKGQGH